MLDDTQCAQMSQKQDGRNVYAIMKIMFPHGYHHSGFVATHAIGHSMYGYTLLVSVSQTVLIKLSKERSTIDHKRSNTQKAQISQK